ncbi:MAG TPA: hypothetical protein PKW14_08875 [Bacteroidota bacterium]|jgi:hypothetical protein|nr:hypothetical protein [Bacteroidota bacterium]
MTLVLFEIGIIFEVIAFLMAYLIFFNEYQKHFVIKKKAIIESLKASFVVFLFLTIIFTIVIFILTKNI